jgi:hypothetical protein
MRPRDRLTEERERQRQRESTLEVEREMYFVCDSDKNLDVVE